MVYSYVDGLLHHTHALVLEATHIRVVFQALHKVANWHFIMSLTMFCLSEMLCL